MLAPAADNQDATKVNHRRSYDGLNLGFVLTLDRGVQIRPCFGAAAFAVTFIPQAATYLVLNGRLWPSDDVARKMVWKAPYAASVLLSPEHGLLLWTPLAAIDIVGLAGVSVGTIPSPHREGRWLAAMLLLMFLKRFSNRPCTTWGGCGTSARTDAGGPMRAYSMDLRERALLDSDAGMKAADVAAKYRVSGSWVRLLKQRRRETGEVAPRVQRHGRRGMLEPHLHTLAALIAAQPDRTLAELKDALATPASVPTVWRAVRALGLTVKKNGPPVRTRSA